MNKIFIKQLNKLLNKTKVEWDSELPHRLSSDNIEKLNASKNLIITTGSGMLRIVLDDNTLQFMEYFYFPNEALHYTQEDIEEMESK